MRGLRLGGTTRRIAPHSPLERHVTCPEKSKPLLQILCCWPTTRARFACLFHLLIAREHGFHVWSRDYTNQNTETTKMAPKAKKPTQAEKIGQSAEGSESKKPMRGKAKSKAEKKSNTIQEEIKNLVPSTKHYEPKDLRQLKRDAIADRKKYSDTGLGQLLACGVNYEVAQEVAGYAGFHDVNQLKSWLSSDGESS